MHHLWYKTLGKDYAGFLSIGWKCENCSIFEPGGEKPPHDKKYWHNLDAHGGPSRHQQGSIYVTCGEIVAFKVMEA